MEKFNKLTFFLTVAFGCAAVLPWLLFSWEYDEVNRIDYLLEQCKSASEVLRQHQGDRIRADTYEKEFAKCQKSLQTVARERDQLKARPLYESDCVRKFARCDTLMREIGDDLHAMVIEPPVTKGEP